MAKLTTAQRNNLPSSAFLLPAERALPVHDRGHWVAAGGRLGNYPGKEKMLRAKWERIGRKRGWLKKKEEKSESLSDTDLFETESNYSEFFEGKNSEVFFKVWDDFYCL